MTVWIHGYKLGRILQNLRCYGNRRGEKVRKLCPGATDEMLEDLRNAGKSFDNRAFTKKYKRILVETDMYKELEKKPGRPSGNKKSRKL